jgi:hypothetical protein
MSENPPAGREGKTGKPASRTGRYLKYAIGEIVLVVVGILIALYVNNASNNKRVDKEVFALYDKVLTELERNIRESNSIIWNFKYKDSIYFLTLDDRITYDDYKTGKIPLNWNTTHGKSYPISHNAIVQLLNYEKEISPEFEKVYDWIKNLHLIERNRLEEKLKAHTNFTLKLIDNQLKYAWFSNNSEEMNNEMIKYYLKSPEHIAWAKQYRNLAIEFYIRRLAEYRDKAIQAYYEIGELIQSTSLNRKYMVNDNYNFLEGEWKNNNGETNHFTFKIKQSQTNRLGEILYSSIDMYDSKKFAVVGKIYLFDNYMLSDYYGQRDFIDIHKIDKDNFQMVLHSGDTISYRRVYN